MNFNKNFSFSKFLLPISVVMLVVGFILLILELHFIPGIVVKGYGLLVIFLFLGGSTLFFIGLVDSFLTRRREVNNNITLEQQTTLPKKTHSIFFAVGLGVIIAFIGFYLLIFYTLSHISG